MNSSSHRLAEVERYIHELAIALAGLPTDEREDVIAGVREHIDDALLGLADAGPADVQQILDDLGDPLAIAADAGAPTASLTGAETNPETPTASRPMPAAPAPASGAVATPTPPLRREWVPAVATLAFPVGAVLVWLGGPGFAFLAVIIWLVGLILLWASPLWQTIEKFVVTAVLAVGLVLLAIVGPWANQLWSIGDRLVEGFGGPRGLFPGNGWYGADVFYSGRWLVAGAVLVSLIAIGAWLWRRGSSRVPR